MTKTTDSLSSPERILILYRSCSNDGFLRELLKRGTGVFYPNKAKDRAPEGSRVFSWSEWRRLNRELRAGKYDLVVCFGLAEGWWRHDRPWVKNLPKLIKRSLRNFGSFAPYLMLPAIRQSGVPLLVYDWDDNLAIGRKNWPLLDACTLYYKTQCPVNVFKTLFWQDPRNDCIFNIVRSPLNQERVRKVRPISYGVSEAPYLKESIATEKTVDVFFSGGVTYSWVRQNGIRQLREMAERGEITLDIPDKPLPHPEYLKRMSRAWLVFSPEGAEWDCTRHHESLLVGTVPVINQPNIRRYKPYSGGEQTLYYNVEDNGLQETVRAALKDKEKLRAIAKEGEAHARRYHLHSHLAELFLSSGAA